MRESEVPQEARDYREAENQRRLVYATNAEGKYIGAVSAGWEPENLATKQAWEDVEERLAETIACYKAGQVSPIAYYMEKCLMDKALLAKYVGKWQWQVTRHLKPEGFKKLSPALLQRYADAFDISIAELQHPQLP